MYTPDGHHAWCSAELQFIGDVSPDERFLRSTVEKAVYQPLLPVLTVGHRLNDRQEDTGSSNSRGEVDTHWSEFRRGSARSPIFGFRNLGGCHRWCLLLRSCIRLRRWSGTSRRCWPPGSSAVLTTVGVLRGKQRMLTWSIRILLAAPSAVPFLQTPKTQAMFPDTLPSFRRGEFDESRAALNGMDSTAHRAVSDRMHLDGLLRLPLWFPSSHLPCRALDSSLVLHERSPGFQRVWRQRFLYHREESVEAAQVCVHVLPQSSQFEEVAVQFVVEPRQLSCFVLRALLQADYLQHVTLHHLRHSMESIAERPQSNSPRRP
ncbi:hypothetical protein T11_8083 [Trichinella zimbabwensis]|uniref:Uncharacterized protein n=1 Tax=Trichinella zimbabwensis TaxID=268475 RepID=A0A0V1HDE8_9BILA|nr:hypothetical protein T11_8083 [Trichinella zimbabwensis]